MIKIVQEITVALNLQRIKLKVFFSQKAFGEKLKKKYKQYIDQCTHNSCSFVFEKPLKQKKLEFLPKTKKEENFYKSFKKFYQSEKEKCMSAKELDILYESLQSFLKNDSITKTWTSFQTFLLCELEN